MLKHPYSLFILLFAECMKTYIFSVQNTSLKWSFLCENTDSDPLFVSVHVISLFFERLSLTLLQIMRKWLFLNMLPKTHMQNSGDKLKLSYLYTNVCL